MSFKADIPTLSANEVYTLTFEYEGTETIQLIVGDLTLETTDRRVVFTTTSPVYYIESNVNLTNLNMYEGYYESDDFGGEYTQESYIEGMSLINLINVTDSDFPKQTSFCDFTINKNISDDKYYTLIVDVSDTSGGFDYGVINNQGTSFTYLSDTITTDGKYIVYRTFNGASQTIRFRGKTSGSPITINSLMLLEGDYSDGNVGHFTGIGCVKSPKIVSRNEDDTEESIITTPDDLELYDGYDKSGNWYGDKLDLITGTFYQYYDMWDLATLLSQGWSNTAFGYNSDTNTVYVQYNIGGTHPSGTVWNGISGYTSALIGNYFEYGYGNANYQQKTSPYIGFLNKYLYFGGMSYDEIFNGITISDNKLNKDEATVALIQFASENKLKIGLPLNTPTIKQINIKPLKSYRNGSITTSSQQLAPTLKTTLPVSNKFTTTNLTSGSTYNVYFDGTATKLDVGGTIITNPVSPCEVECGGTTLTIEGTDIQNVRVIETTVKNEVGNNGTSDVELSKIETSDINGENIITSDLEQPIKLRSLGTTYDSYNPVTGELIKRIGVSETDGSYSVLSSPIVSQVEINNIPRVYKDGIIKIYSDSNIYPMMTLEIPTTNKYDTSTWETGVYTQRNIVEIYFNDSTTPMIPTETLTLTENHLLSGHMIIVGENPMLIKGNYTGRDIPYFTGMRSVEAIEVEVSAFGSPDGVLFGKGGRK